MKDYYDILGVPRNASQDDIKRAYRILAQQFHPDKENGSEKRFKEINEAYRVLSGASSKTDYDRKYDAGLPDEEEAPPAAASVKKPAKRRNYWGGVLTSIVIISLVRLAIGGLSSPSTTTGAASTTNSSDANNSLTLPSENEVQAASLPDTSTQTPTTSQASGTLPTVVGACDSTTVTQVGTRLTDGTTGDPIPGSGSAINYADGGYQVSYDTEPSVQDWQVGDPIDLCFVSAPTDCPAGDDRGIVYQATNKRTGEAWTAQNSEHSCGGA